VGDAVSLLCASDCRKPAGFRPQRIAGVQQLTCRGADFVRFVRKSPVLLVIESEDLSILSRSASSNFGAARRCTGTRHLLFYHRGRSFGPVFGRSPVSLESCLAALRVGGSGPFTPEAGKNSGGNRGRNLNQRFTLDPTADREGRCSRGPQQMEQVG
jgi:hypothetical protein